MTCNCLRLVYKYNIIGLWDHFNFDYTNKGLDKCHGCKVRLQHPQTHHGCGWCGTYRSRHITINYIQNCHHNKSGFKTRHNSFTFLLLFLSLYLFIAREQETIFWFIEFWLFSSNYMSQKHKICSLYTCSSQELDLKSIFWFIKF